MVGVSVTVKASGIEEMMDIIKASVKLIEQIEAYGYENPMLNKSLEDEQEFIDLKNAINKIIDTDAIDRESIIK